MYTHTRLHVHTHFKAAVSKSSVTVLVLGMGTRFTNWDQEERAHSLSSVGGPGNNIPGFFKVTTHPISSDPGTVAGALPVACWVCYHLYARPLTQSAGRFVSCPHETLKEKGLADSLLCPAPGLGLCVCGCCAGGCCAGALNGGSLCPGLVTWKERGPEDCACAQKERSASSPRHSSQRTDSIPLSVQLCLPPGSFKVCHRVSPSENRSISPRSPEKERRERGRE